jgi:hypothetical protein
LPSQGGDTASDSRLPPRCETTKDSPGPPRRNGPQTVAELEECCTPLGPSTLSGEEANAGWPPLPWWRQTGIGRHVLTNRLRRRVLPKPRNRGTNGVPKRRCPPAEGSLELAAVDHPRALGLVELLPHGSKGRIEQTSERKSPPGRESCLRGDRGSEGRGPAASSSRHEDGGSHLRPGLR